MALVVEDEGIGIAPDDLPHVFERFYRGANGTRASGNGLGLALVRAVAEAHGGRVEIASRPGSGTRVALVLPRGLSEAAARGFLDESALRHAEVEAETQPTAALTPVG